MISKVVAKDISVLTYGEIYPLWIAKEHRTGTQSVSLSTPAMVDASQHTRPKPIYYKIPKWLVNQPPIKIKNIAKAEYVFSKILFTAVSKSKTLMWAIENSLVDEGADVCLDN